MMRISFYFPEFENLKTSFISAATCPSPHSDSIQERHFPTYCLPCKDYNFSSRWRLSFTKSIICPLLAIPQIVDTRNQKETWPKASGLPVEFPSPPVIAWHMWTRLVVPVKRSKPRGPVLLEHFSTLSSYHQPLPQSDQPRAGVLRLGEGEVHRVRQVHCKPPRWAAWPAGRARCCRGSGGGWRWAPRSLTETGYLFS